MRARHHNTAHRSTAQLHISQVTFSRPDQTILRDISLTVGPGDRIGLTGPNGAGKSTLLAIGAGHLRPTAGVVGVIPATATVGLLSQEVVGRPAESVGQFIERRLGITAAAETLEEATAALARDGLDGDGVHPSPSDRYDEALQRWLALGAATFDERLPPVLADLGLGTDKADQMVGSLSGGEQGRAGLAAIVLAQFDILLLDEPTNDLDQAGLKKLEALLLGRSAPFVVVSHDRKFLERTVTSVIELDANDRTARRFEGGWAAFQKERAVAAAHEQRRFDDYQDKLGSLKARAQTEREWSAKGALRAARFPRDNDKTIRSFNIEQSENLAGKARRTERAMERLDVVDKPWEPWRLNFAFGTAGRSGDVVVWLTDAVVKRGSFTLGPLSLEIRSGERIQIEGPNGCGKSTLIDAILGLVQLAGGERHLGPSVTIGQLDQRRRLGEGEGSLLQAVEETTGGSVEECRSVLAKFGLDSDHVARPTTELSPGERTRANLAVFQIRGVNTVVLDEPTNHLDIEAIEQLESALGRFDGTLIVVSHDRAFLDNLEISRVISLA